MGWVGLGMRSFEKNVAFFAFFYLPCKRTLRLLRSFTFFEKERCVLCVLLHSLQKNVALFAFFYVLCKRMLRSFTFLTHKRRTGTFVPGNFGDFS